LTLDRSKTIGNQDSFCRVEDELLGETMKTALGVMFLVIVSVAVAETSPSLATVLSPDGRIMEGASGSYDPTGFRMEYGSDGEPLFVEEGSSPLAPVLPPAGQDLDGTWYPLGSGVNDYVYAIAVSGSDVYAGGDFTQAGGNPANHIARWDGSSWSALGSGVNSRVYAIDFSDTGVLYVGGEFSQAGGSPASCIASWDGSSWSALGTGVNHWIVSIAVNGSDVYVGGLFSQAGGSPASRIARWDGSSWSAMGSGVNNSVYAIDFSDTGVLYVGGAFTEAGGNSVHRIASWNGSSWSGLGSGVNAAVQAIAVSGSDVYAGGWFTQAGGNAYNHVARWDGSSWSGLGSGVNGAVQAIAAIDPDVYVGGWFTQAGGSPASDIARWDGSGWSALGSGVSSWVYAIAVSGSDVYVGGELKQAGGSPANYIARWVEDVGIESPTWEVISNEPQLLFASPNPTATGTNLSFQSLDTSPLTLSIYDTAGRLVRTQDLGSLPIGSYSHYWDGRDGNGSTLASGVYFVRLFSAEQRASARVVLVR
jgi:hypothetical protein